MPQPGGPLMGNLDPRLGDDDLPPAPDGPEQGAASTPENGTGDQRE